MKTQSIFEDFSAGPSPTQTAQAQNGHSDQLASYESGFQAGWEDAMEASQKSNTHVSAILARNLETIDFTMAEAQSQILAGLKPVVDEIGATLLPGLASTALRCHISEEIHNFLRDHISSKIALCISESDASCVQSLIGSDPELSSVDVQIKDTLAEGQAYIMCGDSEKKLDVAASIDAIRSSLNTFFTSTEQAGSHVG